VFEKTEEEQVDVEEVSNHVKCSYETVIPSYWYW